MLLLSYEMTPFYQALAAWRRSLAWSALASLAAALGSLWLLFRHLVRGPLARLETDIRRLEQDEFAAIQRTLTRTGGNKAETARILGIGLKTLYRKLGNDQGVSTIRNNYEWLLRTRDTP